MFNFHGPPYMFISSFYCNLLIFILPKLYWYGWPGSRSRRECSVWQWINPFKIKREKHGSCTSAIINSWFGRWCALSEWMWISPSFWFLEVWSQPHRLTCCHVSTCRWWVNVPWVGWNPLAFLPQASGQDDSRTEILPEASNVSSDPHLSCRGPWFPGSPRIKGWAGAGQLSQFICDGKLDCSFLFRCTFDATNHRILCLMVCLLMRITSSIPTTSSIPSTYQHDVFSGPTTKHFKHPKHLFACCLERAYDQASQALQASQPLQASQAPISMMS
jgi:hypothetical protein